MNPKHDLTEILEEYGDNDFGFSTTTDKEFLSSSNEDYERRLKELENIILPFLNQLLKTADQEIIKWPNRAPIIQEQIKKILKLTRG